MILVLLTLQAFFATFVFFCAVLHLRSAQGYLKDAPLIVRIFAYLTLAIGLCLDATLNLLLSFVLVEIPREWLTTTRVSRLKDSGNTWQKSCARWMCRQLDALDKNHCGG